MNLGFWESNSTAGTLTLKLLEKLKRQRGPLRDQSEAGAKVLTMMLVKYPPLLYNVHKTHRDADACDLLSL